MPLLTELFKGNLTSVVKTLIGPGTATPAPIMIDPNRYPAAANNSRYLFEMMGKSFTYFKYSGYSSCVTAYEDCPPVAAILNRKAQAFINGRSWVLNSQGKEATSLVARNLKKLFSNPNHLQSGKQFEAQMYIYMGLFGFAIILPLRPIGFTERTDTTSMWNIPANWIDVNATEELFTKNGGISLKELVVNFQGKKVIFKIEDLIIIRDNTPSFNTLTFPGSKIATLAMPINNIIGALESRNVLINYRGALGVLSADSKGSSQYVPMPMTDIQKEQLQEDFKKYGLRGKQMQVIMTTASLKWQQMGYATKDLMLMEEVQESSKMICDGLNFPPHLSGLINPTYNNQSQLAADLYQNAVIPDAESIYEQYTNWFGLMDLNLRLDKDYSHITALQEDSVEAATARLGRNRAYLIEWRTGLITLDEWRNANGEDPLPDGRGQFYFPEYTAIYGDPNAKLINNGNEQEEGKGKPETQAAS